MWELGYEESWMLKNWCFWTVVWRRLLRLPWTARRSNESILEEISPEYSLEGLMLTLKLQYMAKWYKEMTHWKAWGEGDDRGYDAWMAPSNQWTWVWVSSRSWWWIGKSEVLQSMVSQSWTPTELNSISSKIGKLSSGRRTGQGQFSFQSQRKSISKNVPTTTQLHSSHMLAK